MADWTSPFEASYRVMRVSRATGLEVGQVAGVVSGGTIERNADTATKESGTLTAVGWEGVGPDLVRVWMDATFDDGSTESVALGTFLPSVSERSVGGASVTATVTLTGRLRELSDDMFGQAFSLPAGIVAVDYARQIGEGAGFEVIADESSYALSDRVYYGVSASSDLGNQAETKLDVINDLLSRAGFSSASCDAMGRLVLSRYVEPADRAPAWSFVEGPSATFLRTVTDNRDSSGVANRVYAVYSGDSADGSTGVVGAAEDTSGGEWSIATVGRVIAHKESYSESATQEEADAKAAELLRTSQAVVRRLTISHVYAPVTIGDSIDFLYPSRGVSGRLGVRTQRITLGPGCLTETEGRSYER